jgi:alpha-maltose-1-phosphate synthase
MSTQNLRLAGISVVHIKPRSDAKFVNAADALFGSLGKRFEMVAIQRIALEGMSRYLSAARTFRPDKERWKRLETLNPWAFRQRSELSQQYLDSLRGQFDVAVQLHPLFHPAPNGDHRYVITTDSTYRINQRMWPLHVPSVSDREHDEWVALERETIQGAAALFPWSRFAAQSLIEDYGADPNKVFVIGASGNLPIRPLTKTSYTSQTALYIGYEFERKGGLILLKAWEQVRRALPAARLIIVGPEQPDMPLPRGVEWRGRVNDDTTLISLYQSATVFTLPSLFEPFGHVLIEAMSNGVPVIGTNHCAMPEIITPGKDGLLVPPRDPDALAAALIEVLRQPDEAQHMGQNAYAKASRDYTWDAVVGRMGQGIEAAALTV